jgi:ribonucleoside-diphosphate reductase alpha chain
LTDVDEGRTARTYDLIDYAVHLWRQNSGRAPGLPAGCVFARDLARAQHLAMQASLQAYLDNSISKTINVPEDCSFEAFCHVYDTAYDPGAQGLYDVPARSGHRRGRHRNRRQRKRAPLLRNRARGRLSGRECALSSGA